MQIKNDQLLKLHASFLDHPIHDYHVTSTPLSVLLQEQLLDTTLWHYNSAKTTRAKLHNKR